MLKLKCFTYFFQSFLFIQTNALLEITLSDKNDETPVFVTNDYQTSLKEGALTFIPPVTVRVSSKLVLKILKYIFLISDVCVCVCACVRACVCERTVKLAPAGAVGLE